MKTRCCRLAKQHLKVRRVCPANSTSPRSIVEKISLSHIIDLEGDVTDWIQARSDSIVSESVESYETKQAMKAFNIFDVDQDGLINEKEFTGLVNYPDLQSTSFTRLTDKQIKNAFSYITASKNGKITKQQFYQWYSDKAFKNSDTPISYSRKGSEQRQMEIIKHNLKSSSFLENFKRLAMVPTYYCYLCLENQPIKDGAKSISLSTCKHRYCIECLTEYLVSSVNNGGVSPACFYPDCNTNTSCNIPFSEDEILKLLPDDSQKKYHIFKANKANENNRQCPKCDHTQLGNPEKPSIVCENCEMKYCFMHGNAHQDSDCATFERVHRTEEKKSVSIIAKKCKPCPQCKRMINKSGGCNHMKCPQCECSFCWLCLQEIEDAPMPKHYTLHPGNLRNPCVGRQMEGENDEFFSDLSPMRRRCFLAFFLVMLAGYVLLSCPVSLILTSLIFILCGICILYKIGNITTDSEIVSLQLYQWFRNTFDIISASLCGIIGCLICIPCLLICMYYSGCIPNFGDDDDVLWGDNDIDEAVREFDADNDSVE